MRGCQIVLHEEDGTREPGSTAFSFTLSSEFRTKNTPPQFSHVMPRYWDVSVGSTSISVPHFSHTQKGIFIAFSSCNSNSRESQRKGLLQFVLGGRGSIVLPALARMCWTVVMGLSGARPHSVPLESLSRYGLPLALFLNRFQNDLNSQRVALGNVFGELLGFGLPAFSEGFPLLVGVRNG